MCSHVGDHHRKTKFHTENGRLLSSFGWKTQQSSMYDQFTWRIRSHFKTVETQERCICTRQPMECHFEWDFWVKLRQRRYREQMLTSTTKSTQHIYTVLSIGTRNCNCTTCNTTYGASRQRSNSQSPSFANSHLSRRTTWRSSWKTPRGDRSTAKSKKWKVRFLRVTRLNRSKGVFFFQVTFLILWSTASQKYKNCCTRNLSKTITLYAKPRIN